jgi:gingipain R
MDTIGTLFTHGSIAVLEDASSTAEQTFQTWHIFGDPTLQVRTRAPSQIPAQLPDQLDLSGNNITIDAGASRILVAITDGDKYIGSALSQDDGKAIITIEQRPEPGRRPLITLTGLNRLPLQKQL